VVYTKAHILVWDMHSSQVPLSVDTALSRSGAQLSGGSVGMHALSRALSSAEKRMALLADDRYVILVVRLMRGVVFQLQTVI